MDLALERKKIHSFIDKADERILKIIGAIVDLEEEDLQNTFIIPNEHLHEIRLGEEDIRNGNVVSSRDVRDKALKICMK